MSQFQTVGYSPTANEIKRIVEVAEYLGEDPQVVRNVLKKQYQEVPTDLDLLDAKEIVEMKLNQEDRSCKT